MSLFVDIITAHPFVNRQISDVKYTYSCIVFSALRHVSGTAAQYARPPPLHFLVPGLKAPPPQLTRYDINQSGRGLPRVRLLQPIRTGEFLPSVQSQFFFLMTDRQTKLPKLVWPGNGTPQWKLTKTKPNDDSSSPDHTAADSFDIKRKLLFPF